MNIDVGDWVQAVSDITEAGFAGQSCFFHARRGGIGHVIELLDTGTAALVFFERSGTISLCDVSELRRLGNAEVGRHP